MPRACDLLPGTWSVRAAKFLGTISYGIYLMHGILLFVVFGAFNRIVAVDSLTPLGFWPLVGVCGIVLLAVSAITYRFVEHPFLSVKKSVGDVGSPPPEEAAGGEIVEADNATCVAPDTP